MGYGNLTCHHLGSARISFSLGQCINSHIALLWSSLVLFQAISSKMPRLPTTVVVQTVFGQMTRLATILTVQYDQLSRNYNFLVSHYSHLDVVSCTCYIMVISQNFIEPIYLHQAVLVYPDFLAQSSFYLLSEASHWIH